MGPPQFHQSIHELTSASIPFLVQIDINRIREITIELLTFLLLQGIPRNDLKRLLHIDTFLRTRLKVRHLSRLTIRCRAFVRYHPAILTHVDFITQHHEWKRLGVARRGLNEEFVAPGIECFEGFGGIDVVDQHAAVGAAVEGDAQ
jgi:hypothetical protein